MPETILNTSLVLTQQTFVVAIIAFILLVKTLDSESSITWLTSTYVAEPGFESRLTFGPAFYTTILYSFYAKSLTQIYSHATLNKPNPV